MILVGTRITYQATGDAGCVEISTFDVYIRCGVVIFVYAGTTLSTTMHGTWYSIQVLNESCSDRIPKYPRFLYFDIVSKSILLSMPNATGNNASHRSGFLFRVMPHCIRRAMPLFERSEFLIATSKKKKTDRLCVWMFV